MYYCCSTGFWYVKSPGINNWLSRGRDILGDHFLGPDSGGASTVETMTMAFKTFGAGVGCFSAHSPAKIGMKGCIMADVFDVSCFLLKDWFDGRRHYFGWFG